MIRSRWLVAGEHRIHARVAGLASTGPLVVLVHGIGVSSRYFIPTLEALGTTNPCMPGSPRLRTQQCPP